MRGLSDKSRRRVHGRRPKSRHSHYSTASWGALLPCRRRHVILTRCSLLYTRNCMQHARPLSSPTTTHPPLLCPPHPSKAALAAAPSIPRLAPKPSIALPLSPLLLSISA